MMQMLKNLMTRKAALALAGIVGLGSVAAAPQTAQAGFRIGIDIRDGRPGYQDRTSQVWVEPVYQNVCDRVWVAPTYQTVSDRVWVPDRYEDRQVVRGDRWHRQVCIERVLVPAHYEYQSRQVLVADGHYEDVTRQVLVTPGHWETRVDRVAYCPPGPELDHLHFEFGHR